MLPNELREEISQNNFIQPTAGVCPGYVQANLCIIPKEYAFDFMLFCQRNSKSCPILEILENNQFMTNILSNNCDIRSTIGLYRIYEDGVLVNEVNDIVDYYNNHLNDELISFLIGCSFSFEDKLIENGLNLRHIEENKNVSMYITNIKCENAGIFQDVPLVVSMRPFKSKDVIRAIEITSRFPKVHGAPIHFGDPSEIGIDDINNPDFGDAITINDDEIPVFWCCGVTPQSAILSAKPKIAITHSPGYMLVTDLKNDELLYL